MLVVSIPSRIIELLSFNILNDPFSLLPPQSRSPPLGSNHTAEITPTAMLCATARAALLLAIVGIAAADPRMVKCVDYTDEANQKVIQYFVDAIIDLRNIAK